MTDNENISMQIDTELQPNISERTGDQRYPTRHLQLPGKSGVYPQRKLSTASSVLSVSSSASNNKRKKTDAEGDEDELFCEELTAFRDIEQISIEVRDYLQEKQSKQHKVSNEVINAVGEKLKKVSDIIRKLGLQNAQLIGQVELLKEHRWRTMNGGQASYSGALMVQKNNKIPPIISQGKEMQPTNKHEVLVKTTDESNITVDQMKQKLNNALDPVTKGLQFKNIRSTKKGIVIETAAERDMHKILGCNELQSSGLVATAMKKRNPRIIVYDIPAEFEEEKIKDALANQNDLDGIIRDDIDEHINFKFRTGKKDEATTNWVFEASPKMRNILRRLERVYIGMRRCRVMDFSAITRCYKCQGLGHVSKHCRATVDSCGHCGEDGHRTNDCTKKERPKACALCKRLKKDNKHAANNECPAYKTMVEAWQKSTNYG